MKKAEMSMKDMLYVPLESKLDIRKTLTNVKPLEERRLHGMVRWVKGIKYQKRCQKTKRRTRAR